MSKGDQQFHALESSLTQMDLGRETHKAGVLEARYHLIREAVARRRGDWIAGRRHCEGRRVFELSRTSSVLAIE